MAGLAAGEIFDRRYEIVRLLGSGGMGTVYEARDTSLGRRVALKIPHPHLLGPSHRTRFQREARAAARLWHPNICPIFDIGDVDATLYISMAYLEGRPLGALLHDGEPIDATLATRLLRTLASALQAAHDVGVLHLDLKPANIMVGPHSNPIIMDFGLSRLIAEEQDTAVQDSATLDLGLLGTPAYMAPEQIASQAGTVSTATDIYALGVVFYELLTGRPPFQGSLLSVLEQASSETPPSPRTRCPTLDERLERVCMRMLAKNPSERPGSMNEVVEALEKIEGAERPAADRVPPRRAPSDRERLSDMLARRQAWEVLYYAKRLLQVNQHDAEAYNALSQLSEDPRDLVYLDESRKRHLPNAFTRSMDMKTLVDFVRESGLIERDDGDVICRYNDPSDNMFLILRGDVGVYIPHAERVEPNAQGPDFRLGAGHIVGELAFALKRSRTATVRALGRASLLAFSFARLKELADRGLMGHALSTSVDSYLKRRVLKFLFDSAKYLSSTSAHVVDRGELVNHHAHVIAIDHQQHPILGPDACSRFPEQRGLVILASGEARAQHIDGKLLCDRDLPILFAHFDDRLVYTHARYEIDRPVTLIHLQQAAFRELDQVANGALQEVIHAARTTCAAQCHFDVFLSYTTRDLDIALRWKSRLEAAALRVYMDVQRPPARFVPAIQAAILDSLVFMPLLTENTAARRKRENWVQHEIRYRSDVFGDRANIVPVNLGGGQVAQAAPGHASINAMGRESDAIEQIVTLVRKLRAGELPPPFSLKATIPDLSAHSARTT